MNKTDRVTLRTLEEMALKIHKNQNQKQKKIKV